MPHLPEPPRSLLDRASLFLDFDGTLAEFVEPDRDPPFGATRRRLIVDLGERLDGRVAIVSGRALDDLERLIGIEGIELTGSHGLERRAADGERTLPVSPPTLPAIHADATAFAEARDLVVETKPVGATIHYRGRPDLEEEVRAFATGLAQDHGLEVRRGAMVAEVRAAGPDKGDAVRALMAEAPFRGGLPLFIGDDITDEDGFAAASALGGAGILVGPTRETNASYRLADVGTVIDWLGRE